MKKESKDERMIELKKKRKKGFNEYSMEKNKAETKERIQ